MGKKPEVFSFLRSRSRSGSRNEKAEKKNYREAPSRGEGGRGSGRKEPSGTSALNRSECRYDRAQTHDDSSLVDNQTQRLIRYRPGSRAQFGPPLGGRGASDKGSCHHRKERDRHPERHSIAAQRGNLRSEQND